MSIIRRIISTLLVIAIFGYLFREISNNREVLSNINWQANTGKILLHIVGMFLMQLLLCGGWRFILKSHNAALDNKSLFYSFFVPNLGKYLPGKVLFLAGRVELSYRLGLTRAIGLSTFFFECLFIVIAAAVYIPASLFLLLKLQSDTQILSYLLFAALVLWLTTKTEWFLSVFDKLLLKLKQKPLVIHLDPIRTRQILGFYIIIWAVYGISCAFLAMTLSDAAGWDNFFLIAAAFVVAWLIGFLSIITPGGLGIREGVLVLLLHPIIDNATLMLLAILARLTWTFAELGISSIALLLPVKFINSISFRTPDASQ